VARTGRYRFLSRETASYKSERWKREICKILIVFVSMDRSSLWIILEETAKKLGTGKKWGCACAVWMGRDSNGRCP
jgi:hypothetical protein